MQAESITLLVKGGTNEQMQGLVALVYSTLIISLVHTLKSMNKPIWRIFAIISIPGDVIIMAIFLAKITLLSIAGLPATCRGLTREDCKFIPRSAEVRNLILVSI